jgi:undecaprenyl-diphosphatase
MTTLETWNQTLFLQLNANLATAAWKLSIAALMAEYLILLVPLALVALWCWGSAAQRELALKACAVTFVALGVNQLLGVVWPHPRPFVLGLGHTFIPHATDSSFPSDHATVFASIGLTMVLANLRSIAGWVILMLGACVAWARVYLGVHFPLDMIGAVLVAAAVWLAISPIWRQAGTEWTEWISRIYRAVLARPIALGWLRR